MKAWLPDDHRYVKVVFEPRLRRQFESGGMGDVLRLIVRQVEENLGGTPTAWKWEEEGEAVLAFLNTEGRPVVAVRRNIVIGAAVPGTFMAQLIRMRS